MATSCDPIYNLEAEEIHARILATRERMVANVRAARGEFVWQEFNSPGHLGEVRMVAMQRFLADFPEGLKEGRYRPDALPHLDFDDDKFDLALCSAFLFTYTEQLSLDFHGAAMEEMCRVASEARIFPLLKGNCGPSPYLEPVMNELRARRGCPSGALSKLASSSPLLLLERTLVGSISSTDQQDAIDPSPVATVRSTSFPCAPVNSGRAQKMKYLLGPSQTPGRLEDGQK